MDAKGGPCPVGTDRRPWPVAPPVPDPAPATARKFAWDCLHPTWQDLPNHPCKGLSILAEGRNGQLAEWSKAHAWKVCRRGTVSRVRIPHCPPQHITRCYFLATRFGDRASFCRSNVANLFDLTLHPVRPYCRGRYEMRTTGNGAGFRADRDGHEGSRAGSALALTSRKALRERRRTLAGNREPGAGQSP